MPQASAPPPPFTPTAAPTTAPVNSGPTGPAGAPGAPQPAGAPSVQAGPAQTPSFGPTLADAIAALPALPQTMPARRGFFVLFGSPGAGKSFRAAKAFQSSLYIGSSPNVTAFYDQWLATEDGRRSGLRPPARLEILDRYDVNGQMTFDPATGQRLPVPQRAALMQYVRALQSQLYSERMSGRPLTYQNVIIDEVTTIWDRIFAEIASEMSAGRNGVKENKDGRAHYGALATWTREFLDEARTLLALGANLVAVAHDTEPDGIKKGGPQMPSQRVMRIFAADCDGCILCSTEQDGLGPPKRLLSAFAQNNMISKIRGIPDAAFPAIRERDLSEVVLRAGYGGVTYLPK